MFLWPPQENQGTGVLGTQYLRDLPRDWSPLCPLDNIAVSSDGELPPRTAKLALGFAEAQAGGPAPFPGPERSLEGGSHLQDLTFCPDTQTMCQLNKIRMLLNLI